MRFGFLTHHNGGGCICDRSGTYSTRANSHYRSEDWYELARETLFLGGFGIGLCLSSAVKKIRTSEYVIFLKFWHIVSPIQTQLAK